MMNGHRKSDSSIVPEKWPNNVRGGTAEATEGRGLTKGNTLKQNVPRTQSRTGTSSALERIRQVVCAILILWCTLALLPEVGAV
jgi:hypothetical protein